MRQAPQYVKKKNSADNGINAVPLESNTNGVPLQQPKAHSVERSARLTALEKDYNQLVFLMSQLAQRISFLEEDFTPRYPENGLGKNFDKPEKMNEKTVNVSEFPANPELRLFDPDRVADNIWQILTSRDSAAMASSCYDHTALRPPALGSDFSAVILLSGVGLQRSSITSSISVENVLRACHRRLNADAARIEFLTRRIVALEESLAISRSDTFLPTLTLLKPSIYVNGLGKINVLGAMSKNIFTYNEVERLAVLEYLADAPNPTQMTRRLSWIAHKLHTREFSKDLNARYHYLRQPAVVQKLRASRMVSLLEDSLLTRLFCAKVKKQCDTLPETESNAAAVASATDFAYTEASTVNILRIPENLGWDDAREMYRKAQLLEKKERKLPLATVAKTLSFSKKETIPTRSLDNKKTKQKPSPAKEKRGQVTSLDKKFPGWRDKEMGKQTSLFGEGEERGPLLDLPPVVTVDIYRSNVGIKEEQPKSAGAHSVATTQAALPLKRGERGPCSLKTTEEAPEPPSIQYDDQRPEVSFFTDALDDLPVTVPQIIPYDQRKQLSKAEVTATNQDLPEDKKVKKTKFKDTIPKKKVENITPKVDSHTQGLEKIAVMSVSKPVLEGKRLKGPSVTTNWDTMSPPKSKAKQLLSSASYSLLGVDAQPYGVETSQAAEQASALKRQVFKTLPHGDRQEHPFVQEKKQLAKGDVLPKQLSFNQSKLEETKQIMSQKPTKKEGTVIPTDQGAFMTQPASDASDHRVTLLEERIAAEWQEEMNRKLKSQDSKSNGIGTLTKKDFDHIGSVVLDIRLLLKEPFQIQVHAATLLHYGSLGAAFKLWTKEKHPVYEQFLTLAGFGVALDSLELPYQVSMSAASELFDALSAPISGRLYLGQWYRNMEQLPSVSLGQLFRRLVEVFGTPPLAPFIALGAMDADASVTREMFTKIVSWVGIRADAATALWSEIDRESRDSMFRDNLLQLLSGDKTADVIEEDEARRRSFFGAFSRIIDTTATSSAPTLTLRLPPANAALLELKTRIDSLVAAEYPDEPTVSDPLELLKEGTELLREPSYISVVEQLSRSVKSSEDIDVWSLLQKLPSLKPLAENTLHDLAGCFDEEAFDWGETVLYKVLSAQRKPQGVGSGRSARLLLRLRSQNDPVEKWYLVKKGSAAAIRACAVIFQYKTGDHFGASSLIQNIPCTNEIVAVTDLKLFTLPKSDFQRLCHESFSLFLAETATSSDQEHPEELESPSISTPTKTVLHISPAPFRDAHDILKRTAVAPPPSTSQEKCREVTEAPAVALRPPTLPPTKRVSGEDTHHDNSEKKKKKKKKKGAQLSAKQNIDGGHENITKLKKKKKRLSTLVLSERLLDISDVLGHAPLLSRLLSRLELTKTSLAALFDRMGPSASEGRVELDNFKKAILEELRSTPSEVSGEDLQDLYDELARPLRGRLLLASLYRNAAGPTTEGATILQRLTELQPYCSRWPWCEVVLKLTSPTHEDIQRTTFKEVMHLIGLTETECNLIWKKVTTPLRDAVTAQHLVEYFKGDLTATEIKAQEAETHSFVGTLAQMLGVPSVTEAAEISKNCLTEGDDDDGDEENIGDVLSRETVPERMAEIEPYITDNLEYPIVLYRESHRKYPEEIESLMDLLEVRKPWCCFQKNQMRYMISLMRRLVVPSGNYVFRYNDLSPSLFVVMTGTIELLQTGGLLFNIERSLEVAPSGSVLNEETLLGCPPSEVKETPQVAPNERHYELSGVARGLIDSVVWELSLTDYETYLRPILLERQKKMPYIIRALRIVPLICKLNAVDRNRLAESAKIETFHKGATVLKQNRPGEQLCIILSGIALSVIEGRRNEDGTVDPPKPLGTCIPGEYFGELSLIDNRLHSASVVAQEPLKLMTLDRDAFDDILKPSGVAKRMMVRAQQLYKVAENNYRKHKRQTTSMFFPGKGSCKVAEPSSNATQVSVLIGSNDDKHVPRWVSAPDPTTIHKPRPLTTLPLKPALRSVNTPAHRGGLTVAFDTSTLLPNEETF